MLSGPRFRPWSREKRERRKNDDDVRERQSPRNDPFNLQEILTEVSEIEKAHVSNQTNGDFTSLTMPCKIFSTMIQGTRTGLPGNEQSEEKMCEETDLICHSTKTDTQANEQLSEKRLRRKLMSYYEQGYAIEPFEAIVGEKLSCKRIQSGVKFRPQFPLTKQEVFPFAVPHLRLPLLPSTKTQLVRISQVLSGCKVLPWQLQNMRLEYKREQSSVDNDNDIFHDLSISKDSDRKTALKVFIPGSC